jgi:hypothetical protein
VLQKLEESGYPVTIMVARGRCEPLITGSILAAALVVWTGFHGFTRLSLEDALITFRYARNLTDGNGFVYNVGERVLGTTTPLLTLLLGGIGSILGAGVIPTSAVVLGMAGMAGAAVLTFGRTSVRRKASPGS